MVNDTEGFHDPSLYYEGDRVCYTVSTNKNKMQAVHTIIRYDVPSLEVSGRVQEGQW